jgi:hypothetical protein
MNDFNKKENARSKKKKVKKKNPALKIILVGNSMSVGHFLTINDLFIYLL